MIRALLLSKTETRLICTACQVPIRDGPTYVLQATAADVWFLHYECLQAIGAQIEKIARPRCTEPITDK